MGIFVFLLIMTVMCSVFMPLNDGLKYIYKTEQIIKEHGYVCETHHLMTTDGYMLGLHRMPYKRYSSNAARNRPVILLMHGMFGASNSFLMLGPENSIAYNLADAGFDVWMCNARGTKHSRFHIHYDPDHPTEKQNFFDFTYEEIALNDLADTVDYVLAMTEVGGLHFIGMGAGGTAFLVLNSLMPSYNDKFLTAHLLAGVGYQEHFKNPLLKSLATFTNTYYRLWSSIGLVELFPPGSADNAVTGMDVPRYCTGDLTYGDVCELMGVAEIMGPRLLQALVDSETAGASIKQVAHYGQNIRSKKFRRWDFGPKGNLKAYKSEHPPDYNLRLVTVNTTFHYSVDDHLVDEKDVLNMVKDMPNCVARKVPKKDFQHFDFMLSPQTKTLVTDFIRKRFHEHGDHTYRDFYNVPWHGGIFSPLLYE